MNDSYYVKVAKRYGFLGLRLSHIDTFFDHETAIYAIRRLEASTYNLKTYWGGDLFDEDDCATDGEGNVFKNTEDGVMRITGYFHHARNYTYPKAFICNSFMQDERLKNESILNKYIKKHKVTVGAIKGEG